MASPISTVDTTLSPGSAMSPVRRPLSSTAATASSMRRASLSMSKEKRSMSAAESTWAMGFATPLPAMSGAEPPEGSYMCTRSPRDAEGMRPSDPGSTEAASERMSPNMFSVTSTSKWDGFLMICMAALSTSMNSMATSGKSLATSCATLRQSLEQSRTLALSTTVTCLDRERLASKPYRRATRIWSSVYSITSRALLPSVACSPK
mmetsp:Transcript_25661/g.86041  ORF Transcript_25661/g.86041 Transcript_25661/m.86041 type:complete len:206 (-) Transcript_25661:593-1210(-)